MVNGKMVRLHMLCLHEQNAVRPNQRSAGVETRKEDKNQQFLYVHWWKKCQRQCRFIAQ